MKSLLFLISLFMLFLVQPSPSSAAQIEPVKNHPMGCEYKLSGLINDGDAEKIGEVLGEVHSSRWYEVKERGWKICLNSPGGSFVEGVKLAKTFKKYSIGTVVAENKVCESSCAVAFMGGTYSHPEGEGSSRVSRAIHATAKLGFHAPALLIQDGNYSKSEVAKAYNVALKAVVELSDMRATGMEIRESLFKSLLTTPVDRMHYVDTVGKALRYKIDVSGVDVSNDDVQTVAHNFCNNAVIAIEDVQYNPAFANSEFALIGNTLTKSGGFYAEASADCEINIILKRNNIRLEQFNKNEVTVSFKYLNEEPFASYTLSPFASFPSTTLLASAFSGQTISLSDFDQKARISLKNNNSPTTCGYPGDRAYITNVQNFTNLRQKAGLNGQIIDQVPLGAKVIVRNPGRFLRYDRCATACNGTNQNAIKQCIDNNDVWIEVYYNKRRGFLSRKFLL